MKGVVGFLLFIIGLALTIKLVINVDNYSIWYSIITCGILGYGLDLIIVDKIDEAKEEINKANEEIMEKIKELEHPEDDRNPYE